MIINFVISKDLQSRILRDIYQRFLDYPAQDMSIIVSEQPVEGADVFHYHRPHLEETLAQPAIVTVHHDPMDIDPWLYPDKFEKHYREAQRVVCLNSLQVDFYHNLGISNTTIIPHGYDSKLLYRKKAKTYQADHKLKLGVISKRYARRVKGEVYLQELMLRLDPQRFEFVFVGAGRTEDALLARSFGFEATVFEHLPYRMFGNLYETIDFLVMVSNYEGGPANLPEAVASCTPVLATKIGMAVDLIVDGVNGCFLSGNIEQDINLFERLAVNDRGIVETLFWGAAQERTAITWEEVTEKYMEVYRDVAKIRQKVSDVELQFRLSQVRLLTLDVDGVLTDGWLYYNEEGEELKRFNVKDGLGIQMLIQSGVEVAIVSNGTSPSVQHRAEKLGIKYCLLGIEDKLAVIQQLSESLHLSLSQVAHVGDDLTDFAVLQAVGCPITVADGIKENKRQAIYITEALGGHGAVREICDLVRASVPKSIAFKTTFNHVISLGCSTNTVNYLQELGLDKFSMPFDLLFSNLDVIEHILKDEFKTLLDRELMITCTATRTGHLKYHELLFNQRNPKGSDEAFEYYQAAIDRFLKVLKTDEPKLFIHTAYANPEPYHRDYMKFSPPFTNIHFSLSRVQEFFSFLSKLTTNATLLVILQNPEQDKAEVKTLMVKDNLLVYELCCVGKSSGELLSSPVDDINYRRIIEQFRFRLTDIDKQEVKAEHSTSTTTCEENKI
jgi:YrbI family 3-deoxy-D-manno-octulosonate 8-phosphate phosphatase